jgi:hypothetical protein
MKQTDTLSDQESDRWGTYFSEQLTLACADLPHDICERLRVGRHLAMAQRKPSARQTMKGTSHHVNGTLTAPADEDLSLWRVLACALPLVALVIGLTAIDRVLQDDFTSELAATDSALLTDELPPDAYTDAGFAQFLKQGIGRTSVHD